MKYSHCFSMLCLGFGTVFTGRKGSEGFPKKIPTTANNQIFSWGGIFFTFRPFDIQKVSVNFRIRKLHLLFKGITPFALHCSAAVENMVGGGVSSSVAKSIGVKQEDLFLLWGENFGQKNPCGNDALHHWANFPLPTIGEEVSKEGVRELEMVLVHNGICPRQYHSSYHD